ncbi:tetratricopeptide repeat protein [Nannocystis pusilla]|uniref:Tetratricopeptide repeat protein n=1 Tax=Nannocystis pusilla TaxID=889268 RepID=A0A9X3ERG2_9BACT|nr:tetratricopeptide repeat protein [Nannocystis pusilla]MCY1004038.1 tetratricopeptide repeat protein [Nannocystis pusilla]
MAALIDVLVETPKRRKRRALAAGLVVALAGSTALGATIFASEKAKSQCSQDEISLAELWNEDRKATLHEAFTTTGLPYAEKSWQRVSSMLDAYARDWAEVAVSNCEARQTAAQPLERRFAQGAACLSRQHDAFSTLLADFAAADRALVASADKAVAGLSPPEPCRVTSDMQNVSSSVGPINPRVRDLLDRGKLLTITHEGRDAVAFLDTALAEIRSTADVAGEAEALLLLGQARGRLLSDGPGAEDLLNQAYDRANTANHTALQWKIWNELAYVHVVLFDAPAEARRDLAHARSSRPLDSQEADTALRDVESDILIAENRAAEAVVLRRSSLESLQSYHTAGHPDVVEARLSLAAALGDAGKSDEARTQHMQLFDELKQEFGSEHPYTARVELNLGIDLLDLEQLDAARKHFEHARAALMRTYGEVHLLVAKAELALANLDFNEEALPVGHGVGGASTRSLHDSGPAGPQRARRGPLAALGSLPAGRPPRSPPGDRPGVARHLRRRPDAQGLRRSRPPYQHRRNTLPARPMLRGAGIFHASHEALPHRDAARTGAAGHSPAGDRTGAPAGRQTGPRAPVPRASAEVLEQSPHERGGVSENLGATMRDVADALTALRREPRRVRELRRRADELQSAE